MKAKYARQSKSTQQSYILWGEKSICRRWIAFKRVWLERIPAPGITLAIPAVQSSKVMAEASEPDLSKKCMVSMDTGNLSVWFVTRGARAGLLPCSLHKRPFAGLRTLPANWYEHCEFLRNRAWKCGALIEFLQSCRDSLQHQSSF